jgi:DNA-binding NtrC family response regulator
MPELSAQLIEALCLYQWPLNVRELELVAKRTAIVHGHRAELSTGHLPPEVLERRPLDVGQPRGSGAAPDGAGSSQEVAETELTALIQALEATDGNVLRASVKAKMSRQKAYRLIAMHDIDLQSYRRGTA